ncbi:enoyl-CoA hydratase/isomerase family protein [Streptomonospora salina]|uniref:Enoyl-CoA hydratase/carnithine racemase n=1 Tax=Streptomonospora salina TaxID=104205 RepID=A0A841EMN2_9ACTN|nr:enoyl-CoA hydratase/isomerase family protein [Streptomonospora salina]MBB6000681.1 enoyl-CoA hydratase/carnithine racemase [Streptomonospora salina]
MSDDADGSGDGTGRRRDGADAGGDGGPGLLVSQRGGVLTATFDRPARRNAMTWAMYEELADVCERADADDDVRALLLTGAGDTAFVAGSDIGQFAGFTDGADGVDYERRLGAIIDRLAAVQVPTLAAVRGYCVGGGLIIAASCDLRIAAPSARFGVPIARTLGNCLGMSTYALLVDHLGPGRTLDLLLTARMLTADEAHAAGFVTRLAADEDLDAEAAALTDRLAEHSPLSMWAAKESVRRLRRANLPEDRDILERAYGSEDFRNAVAAFGAKTAPTWRGR